jgi:hypothetical protein
MRKSTDLVGDGWETEVMQANLHRAGVLNAIKLAHTAIWAILGSCVLAIPVAAALGSFRSAAALSAIIAGECAALACNRGRCPLTSVAARFTDERTPNCDIYLPAWFARHNKAIFGSLFVAGDSLP